MCSRPRRCLAVALAAPAAAAALLAPANALAFEDEWRLGARAGFATLEGGSTGPAVGLHAGYALSDMFDVTFEGLASHHGADEDEATEVLGATVGAAYKVDVFEWVPYLAVLVGYYHHLGAPGPDGGTGALLGGAGQAGLDYLVSRNLSLGAELRWHTSFTDALSTVMFSGTLGAAYRFGP